MPGCVCSAIVDGVAGPRHETVSEPDLAGSSDRFDPAAKISQVPFGFAEAHAAVCLRTEMGSAHLRTTFLRGVSNAVQTAQRRNRDGDDGQPQRQR